MTRARYPDETGFIERDGVRVFWERYGDGGPAVLLLPTWTILHSRCWKAQSICAEEEPALVDRGQAHPVACHFAEAIEVV